eukprot:5176738-Pleurochrysis_carterae.AAC.1
MSRACCDEQGVWRRKGWSAASRAWCDGQGVVRRAGRAGATAGRDEQGQQTQQEGPDATSRAQAQQAGRAR